MIGKHFAASRLVAIVLPAVIFAACSSTTAPAPPPVQDTTTTEYLYKYDCAGCHGLGGSPLGAGIGDLRNYDSTFAHFDSVLTDGPGLMPRFPQIDSVHRRALYDYIRENFKLP